MPKRSRAKKPLHGSHVWPSVQSAERSIDNSQCPLFRLPGELRNRIYRLCLVEPNGLTVDIRRKPPTGRVKDYHNTDHEDVHAFADSKQWLVVPPKEPPLLGVCKLIRSEAFAVFYGENLFSIPLAPQRHSILFDSDVTSRLLRYFAKALGPAQVKALGSLRIGFPDRPWAWVAGRTYWATSRRNVNGTIIVTLEGYDGIRLEGQKTVYCPCELVQFANKGKPKGDRLISVLKRFCDDYFPKASGFTCKGCGLPTLDRGLV
ncbi:hypothetical protein Slin15195_G095470 [Septoria linicola]|uniref:2EXR domain-containing protein n=1 Tax=Septoria linicola TaxID=215465 RepID=A0A9Q9AZS3_9PEZI|nr:hypothetical protein Slin15195_G095470 [Septoria linicola]